MYVLLGMHTSVPVPPRPEELVWILWMELQATCELTEQQGLFGILLRQGLFAVLAVMELALYSRITSNSKIHLPLPHKYKE